MPDHAALPTDALATPSDDPSVSAAPAPLSTAARVALHERAAALITAMCQGDRWRMSIPANPDRDSDILLSTVLADAAALGRAVDAVALTMDVMGVPRSRQEVTFSLEERVSLFIDRLSERLHTQVENNMIYFNLCREVLVLLKGSPNASNFRVKTAIAKLEAVTVPQGQSTASGLSLVTS